MDSEHITSDSAATIGAMTDERPGQTSLGEERLVPQRVFAKPFRLTFEKKSGETTLIEVKTLDGLKEVVRRRNDGEIFEINGYTIEIQLWGVLAEHCGFMRTDTGVPQLSTGIQPFSDVSAALTADLAELYGSGDDTDGIKMLDQLRQIVEQAKEAARDQLEHNYKFGKFVKDDGVNLTEAGEEKLAALVGESLTGIDREAYHAEALVAASDPEDLPEDIEMPGEGETITGEEATDIGRRVEEAGMGELDKDTDEDAPGYEQ